jgi:hypothetical protein
MTTPSITVQATLQPDGMTLHLEEKLALPPGKVTLTVQPTELQTGPTMLKVLNRIHSAQRQRGRREMTEEEIAEEIDRMRAEDEEYEERWRQIWRQTGTKPKGTDNP